MFGEIALRLPFKVAEVLLSAYCYKPGSPLGSKPAAMAFVYPQGSERNLR